MSLWGKLLGRGRSGDSTRFGGQGGTLLRSTHTAGAAASATPAPSLAPDAENKIAGIFPVKEVLGAGAMGTVYLAQHPSWNTEVALKVPKAELIADAENRHRITVEAEAWTELGLHPNIAYCYYVQTIDGVLLMVVEYVDGGNLEQWIARHGQSATLKSKLDLAIQFCHALEHAHAKGTIHRDIKPSNVLLTKEGQLKLTDFGIARVGTTRAESRAAVAGARVDGTMVGIGTEDYMPPEQWESAQVDARADLFAFGVCLYELFCGARPYAGRLLGAPAKASSSQKLNPTLPPPLSDLLEQCVCWNKEQRPESAQGIRERLCTLYEQQFQAPCAYAELPPFTMTASALNNRALSYIELGQPDRAVHAWQAAIQADAKHIETIYNFGLHEWRSARLTDDILIRRLEEEVAADNAATWLPAYLRAQIHLETGDGQSAIRALEAVAASESIGLEMPECERAAKLLSVDSPPACAVIVHAQYQQENMGYAWPVCLSADFRLAFSSSSDGRLTIVSPADGACLRAFDDLAHRAWCLCLSADGLFGVSGGGQIMGADQPIKIWELSTGRCRRTMSGHADPVTSICLSVDGRHALSGSGDRTVKFWDLGTGQCIWTLAGHTESITSVSLSADGRLGLSGSRDQTLKLWDLTTGRCLRTFNGHGNAVSSVCLSDDGRRALSGSWDKTLRLWDVVSGQCMRSLNGHLSEVHAVCMSADGSHALSGSGDRTARFWDLATGRCLRTFDGHTNVVQSVFLSANGRVAASSSHDGSLRHWPLPARRMRAAWRPSALGTSGELIRSGSAHRQVVSHALRAMSDGDWARAGRLLKSVRGGAFQRDPEAYAAWARLYLRMRKAGLRDHWSEHLPTTSMEVKSDHWSDLILPRICVCTSVDGRHALSTGRDETFKLWEVNGGRSLRTFSGHTERVTSVCMSVDGRYALSGSKDKTVRLWDLVSGECLRTFAGHTESCMTVCLSVDCRLALSGSVDKALKLWDLASGHCLRSLGGHAETVDSVCLSADGCLALSGSSDGTLKLWDLAGGHCLRTFTGHSKSVNSVCLSVDDRHALSAGGDHTLRLWDLETGQCLRTFSGHSNEVNSACLSIDRRYALSGSADRTLKLWDLASGECLRSLSGHNTGVTSVCLSAEGGHAVSADVDGPRVWSFDWELEDNEAADWDEGARPYLEVFLRARQPYAAALPPNRTPTDEEVTHALSRSGEPVWSEEDFERVIHTLGCAGYGWLRPAGVRNALERMASRPRAAAPSSGLSA